MVFNILGTYHQDAWQRSAALPPRAKMSEIFSSRLDTSLPAGPPSFPWLLLLSGWPGRELEWSTGWAGPSLGCSVSSVVSGWGSTLWWTPTDSGPCDLLPLVCQDSVSPGPVTLTTYTLSGGAGGTANDLPYQPALPTPPTCVWGPCSCMIPSDPHGNPTHLATLRLVPHPDGDSGLKVPPPPVGGSCWGLRVCLVVWGSHQRPAKRGRVCTWWHVANGGPSGPVLKDPRLDLFPYHVVWWERWVCRCFPTTKEGAVDVNERNIYRSKEGQEFRKKKIITVLTDTLIFLLLMRVTKKKKFFLKHTMERKRLKKSSTIPLLDHSNYR